LSLKFLFVDQTKAILLNSIPWEQNFKKKCRETMETSQVLFAQEEFKIDLTKTDEI